MKKALKIIGIVVLLLIIFLLVAPFLFKGTIEKQVKKAINENLNATVEWQDLSLSLLSSFPDARLKLEDISVINKAPFAGDTLVYAKTLFLDMGIPQLFKGGNLTINELGLEQALVNVKVDKNGVANYDITKTSAETTQDTTRAESDMNFAVQHYSITDSRINYLDESSKMFLRLKAFNHQGTGDFSASTSTLKTQTDALVSFAMDSTTYFENTKLDLTADIQMDLDKMRFTFANNKALINQLPLTFAGYVQVNDANQEMDLTFKTPTSDFKNFLGVMPAEYAKNLDQVQTTGKFSVDGRVYGVVDDTHIPKINIAVNSNDASFKYPDLPKSVEHISIDAVLKNATGLMKDMNLDLNKLAFQIDRDKFEMQGHLKDLTGNMLVDLMAKGTLNLANIEKAYPVDMELDLDGVLQANLSADFAMSDIEHERYSKIKTQGAASLRNFSYSSTEMAHPVKISQASLSFDPGNVVLKQFDMTTGQTDAHLTGKLENLMGFLFKNQPVKGRFKLTSNTFSVNDFMMASPADTTQTNQTANTSQSVTPTSEEAIKIPSFLDVALDFSADKVLYDNLTLTNAKGILLIKDETATLKDITADIFGGTIGLDGSVATKTATPKFNVALSLKKVDIVQSIQEMDLFQKFAPILKGLVGNLTTSISLSGDLTKDLMPVYNSLTGDGLAAILNAKVDKAKMPLLSQLDAKLNFMDLDKLNLDDLTAHFSFEDGAIKFKPFDFKLYKGITAHLGGSHSFTNNMNYTLDLDVPAKYLGKDVSQGLAKLSKTDLENTKVDLPIAFTGTLTSPKIQVDFKAATKTLTDKIIAEQKDNLKDKVSEGLSNLLGGGQQKDSTTQDNATATDTIQSKEDKVKDAAKNVLEGLFGKKKRSKDSVK